MGENKFQRVESAQLLVQQVHGEVLDSVHVQRAHHVLLLRIYCSKIYQLATGAASGGRRSGSPGHALLSPEGSRGSGARRATAGAEEDECGPAEPGAARNS
jgi:hypothetical protein